MPRAVETRIAVIIRSSSWLGIVAHASFVPLFALTGQRGLAAFNVLSVAIWIAAWQINRRGASTLAMWLLTGEVAAHAVLAVMNLGWGSGFQYYLIPLIPFLMFNERAGTKTVAVGSGVVLAIFIALRWVAPPTPVLPPVLREFVYANLFIPFLMLGLLSYYFRLASTAVERTMTKIAQTDPLTGLLNRRSMEERLDEEVARFRADGANFSVIIADVDHFKQINDQHGHDAGDRVLAGVASVFNNGLRGGDAVARWGGEEFLLLLPGTDLRSAEEVAQRLRIAAEQGLAKAGGLPRTLTLTFGVAGFGQHASIDGCLKAADEALYRGKAAGRNRVVVAAQAEP
ncbi:MAG TPA: diguanylate cyclase [Polyangiaceae bacterium]|nr:diguanylate cyclase [Polyangiaceae bacterium]